METIYKEIEKKVDDLIELMRVRINEEGVKTKKLAEIIQMALGMAGDSYKALIEGKMEPDRIPGCIRQYFNCIKIKQRLHKTNFFYTKVKSLVDYYSSLNSVLFKRKSFRFIYYNLVFGKTNVGDPIF